MSISLLRRASPRVIQRRWTHIKNFSLREERSTNFNSETQNALFNLWLSEEARTARKVCFSYFVIKVSENREKRFTLLLSPFEGKSVPSRNARRTQINFSRSREGNEKAEKAKAGTEHNVSGVRWKKLFINSLTCSAALSGRSAFPFFPIQSHSRGSIKMISHPHARSFSSPSLLWKRRRGESFREERETKRRQEAMWIFN